MTKGIIALLIIWGYLVFNALRFPWIGFVGYGTFAVLCPPWNWRWGLPALDYQKFLAIATLLGWLFTGLQRQRLTPAAKLVMFGAAGYLLLSFLSSLVSVDPVKSAMYMDITWKIALMCTVGIFVMREPNYLTALAWALLFAQGWNALSINQLYLERGFINVNNFSWNYLDNNTYCISSVPVMALAVGILMTAEKNWQRAVSGFVFTLQLHQLMILQSRGTMIGGLVLIIMGVFFMPKNRTTWTMVVVSFVLGCALAGPSVVDEFMSSFVKEDKLDSSAESRFKLWKAGAQIMVDHPLLGVGPWAGERFVPQYYDGYLGVSVKALHNLFFEIGTGCGVPALLSYLTIFAVPLWAHFWLWYRERDFMPAWMRLCNLSILCGIPGYWVSSMFSSGALIEAPYMLVLLGTAALPVYQTYKENWFLEEELSALEDDSTEPEPTDEHVASTVN